MTFLVAQGTVPRASKAVALRRRGAFGRRLRALRTERGLSQEALADLAGIHRTYIGSVERGERNIALDNSHARADALGVSAARLVADDPA